MESSEYIELQRHPSTVSLQLPQHPSSVSLAPRSEYDTEDENKHDEENISPPLQESPTSEPEQQYPSGLKFWLALTTLCLGIFLVTLDSTILATAIPHITDEFHSIKDIGWYGSIYLMALCVSQLPFGKLSARYSIRGVYTGAMIVFLVGSAVCGAAPNSPALIAGRAIAGLGSSGLLITAYSVIPSIAPPPKRALSLSMISMARSVAATAGPLIGGALTQKVSWRWTFYINLPLGAVIYLAFLFSVSPPKREGESFTSFANLIETLDLIGFAALIPSVVCLLLALQWGGVEYSWSSGRIIALLVVFGVLGVAFIAIEFWQGDKAMLPSRVFAQRSISYASFYGFCSSGAIYVLTYYLPIWFQGVKGASPLTSAVNTLPWLITSVITLIGGGVLISKLGHADAWMLVGTVFGSVGSGLFTTFTPTTSTGKWIGYQIIFAIGSSLFSVTPLIIAQNRLALKDIPIGSSMVAFAQIMGSSIFLSVAQALFTNDLTSGLTRLGIEGLNGSNVVSSGINNLTNGLAPEAKQEVLRVINSALTNSWLLPVVLTCISVVGALGVEHRKA